LRGNTELAKKRDRVNDAELCADVTWARLRAERCYCGLLRAADLTPHSSWVVASPRALVVVGTVEAVGSPSERREDLSATALLEHAWAR
jgi:hypothetical protein